MLGDMSHMTPPSAGQAARTYVVTGSASGMGRATTQLLEAEGHRVIGVDRAGASVECDLATAAGRDRLADGVAELAPDGLDGVIACAGLSGSANAAEPVVRVNYFGAVASLERLRPLLAGSAAPAAVVVASCALLEAESDDDPLLLACLDGDEAAAVALAAGYEGLTAYRSVKRAVARWVRREAPGASWAGARIALNAIAPGFIDTPMVRPEIREQVAEKFVQPLSGPGRPEDIAAGLAWLAGPGSRLVCGQVIFFDGGYECALRGELAI